MSLGLKIAGLKMVAFLLLASFGATKQLPEKIWEVPLSSLIRETLPLLKPEGHHVAQILFSDDEQWILVSAGSHFPDDEKEQNHLLLLKIDRSPEKPIQYDYNGDSASKVILSQDHRLAALQQTLVMKIINLTNGETCEVEIMSKLGGFIDGRVVAGSIDQWDRAHSKTLSSKLHFYDPSCTETDTWALKGGIRAVDVAESTSRIAVGGKEPLDPDRILDYQNHQILASFEPLPLGTRSNGMALVDGGKAVCFPGSNRTLPTCLEIGKDLQAAHVFDNVPKLRMGRPISTARQGQRIAVEDVNFSYKAFSERTNYQYKGVVVYDYRTGQEVARVPVSLQRGQPSHFEQEKWLEPYAFALSPSGHYLAEAGEDTLRLYALP